MAKIKIMIRGDRTEISVAGVAGPSCLSLTEELERRLGGKLVLREELPEMHEAVELEALEFGGEN